MTDTYKLGTMDDGPDPSHWTAIDTLMRDGAGVFNPDPEFDRFSGIVELDDGTSKGTGLPIATWHINVISDEQRAELREFCPESQTSAEVYVSTPTNEVDDDGDVVWFLGSAVMKWVTRREDKDTGDVIGFDLEFSMMVEIEEP